MSSPGVMLEWNGFGGYFSSNGTSFATSQYMDVGFTVVEQSFDEAGTNPASTAYTNVSGSGSTGTNSGVFYVDGVEYTTQPWGSSAGTNSAGSLNPGGQAYSAITVKYADGTTESFPHVNSQNAGLTMIIEDADGNQFLLLSPASATSFETFWTKFQDAMTNADGSPATEFKFDMMRSTGSAYSMRPEGFAVMPGAVVCFTKATMIKTANGEIAIEDLKIGDMVETLENGLQEVKWVGKSTVSMNASVAPIVFTKGSIGNEVELRVSPMHSIYLSDWRAEVLFSEENVLVPAKFLVNGETIYSDASEATIDYYHFATENHEIVTANGVLTETLHIGEQALKAFSADKVAEIKAIFPELVANMSNTAAAAKVLSKSEAAVFATK